MPNLRTAVLALAAFAAMAPNLSADAEVHRRAMQFKNTTAKPFYISPMTYRTRDVAVIVPNNVPANAKMPDVGWLVGPSETVDMVFAAHYKDRDEVGSYGFRVRDWAKSQVEYIMVNNNNGSNCDWFQFSNVEDAQDFDYSTVTYKKVVRNTNDVVHLFTFVRPTFSKFRK
ncbi:hypothetical protein [Mesoterricola silvestris]|uniref:Uncharacterized protein n=1 Tax=Mesoterricola silvestris TaxID=2927979 RepID=A0AA48K992_9BACT|nr:hypothetical protein [Mesoterricola silvestris]BDU72082.1 hypothetical protein METEAL_12560 [Mesoterricola silvestris]